MVDTGTPEHYVQCALVYIDDRQQHDFIIKCLLCRLEYTDWAQFAGHIQLQHKNSKKTVALPKDSISSMLEDTDDGTYLEKYVQKKIVASADANQEAFEMTLISDVFEQNDNTVVSNGADQLERELMYKDCTIKGLDPTNSVLETLIDFKVELVDIGHMDVQRLNAEISGKPWPAVGDDNLSICNRLSPDEQNLNQISSTSSRCFFHLRHTEPHIILIFIELIRQHPCQWNIHHPDYALKEKRDESAAKICDELKEILNIVISPQLARSSILYLCRWFEREHLRAIQSSNKKIARKTGRWSRNGYVCAQPDYYRKLLEFLPYKHLKPLFCATCRRTFKAEAQWLAHQHQMHGAETPYKCRYCKRSFRYPSSLRHHENRHTKERLWQCNLCDYTSATKTDFHLHMVAHTDIRAYVCELCNAAYKSSTSLKVHIRTHEPPRLECSHCGKKFYENYRLKRHLWIHQAETSAEAAVAADEAELYASDSPDSMNNYEAVVQKSTTDSLASGNEASEFGCTLCELTCDSLNDLRSHALRTHDTIIL